MSPQRCFVILISFLLASVWSGIGQEFVTNSYTPSTEDFANPERGFYIQSDTYASSPSSVPSNLASYRVNGKSSPGGTYTAKISLLMRVFYLDSFIDAPISSNFLSAIQADFDSIRAQGCKVIVRFAYNQDQTRPFNEPTKARILSHIAQLKPLLQRNSDVIAVLQHGFIGAWGEGYYTDVFYTNGQATTQNWNDRADVIAALLDALPADRMIQVRVPQHKQKYVYGPSAPLYSPPLDPLDAFNGTDAARIGFHNDCFLASSDDYGTFANYDYGQGTSAGDIAILRNYMALETRFAPMGGETCAVNPPTDDCSSAGGGADSDMELFHYSFLNEGYNANVNNDWVTQGCIEDIKRRLGYRLELLSAVFRSEAQPGQTIPLTLQFRNVGFASPFNPRGLELVLRNTTTGNKYFAELSSDNDVRRWLPGSNIVLNALTSLPTNMPLGSYEMLLNLPDPAPTLYSLVPYSVRLANSNAVSASGALLSDVWEPATGYNRLGYNLTVNATATNPPPSGTEIPLLDFSVVRETYETWKARNFALNPAEGAPDADPDSDGRKNLLEYAIGSNPNSGGDPNYFTMNLESNALFLSVRKGPGTKDVLYEVESSADLTPGIWSTTNVDVLENSTRQIRVRYEAANSSGFLRLKVALKQ